MNITRWTHTGQYGAEIYTDEDEQGLWIKHEDYLAAVEELEYSLRYEREQKEEAEHERDFYKKLCEDNLDMSDVEF